MLVFFMPVLMVVLAGPAVSNIFETLATVKHQVHAKEVRHLWKTLAMATFSPSVVAGESRQRLRQLGTVVPPVVKLPPCGSAPTPSVAGHARDRDIRDHSDAGCSFI